jgi:hypothetical protein
MAFEMDLESIQPQSYERTVVKPQRGAQYDPMRRKLDIVDTS